MNWLQELDTEALRWVRNELSNPLFDLVMPFLSRNSLFLPAAILLGVLLVWKGRLKGLVCLLMLLVVIAIGDGFICSTLKDAFAKPRPPKQLEVLNGPREAWPETRTDSLPSSHAANWFSAAMVMFLFYRRSARFIVPVAVAVSFSRVYNGAHFPSDVLAGALIGAGYGAAIAYGLEGVWNSSGKQLFPLWWQRFPSLLRPVLASTADEADDEQAVPPRRKPGEAPPVELAARHVTIDEHWLRLGYVVIGLILSLRLVYIASDAISLSDDEAYQWVWSKHPAISYYSKPPLIAGAQWLGTHLWGDTEFGVRFCSPLIGALLGIAVLRFFSREVNARAGFFLLLIVTTTPMLAAGSVLMTVDPLSVLFWTLSMMAGWKAMQERGSTRDWALTGLWLGLGFLSKYTALFQLLCWAVLFWLWKPARKHLARPGPYVGLFITLICTVPVIIWNAQHDWVTVTHVAEDAGSGKTWSLGEMLKGQGDVLGAEFFLLNPVYFVGALWAAIVFWKKARNNPRLVYFFSMGAPLVAAYMLQSFRSKVLPNWIAPAVLPLFFLMVTYWDTRLRLGSVMVKRWLITGLVLGTLLVVVSHDTDVIRKVTGRYLPVKLDPLRRVRAWDQTARAVMTARQELLAEGKPVFIIGGHYGIVSQLTFHIPEARASVTTMPLVYHQTTESPRNQYFFWPGYTHRKGENAIYVQLLNRDRPLPKPPPGSLVEEFEAVEYVGIREVRYHGELVRPFQVFHCRNLK